MRNQYTLHVSMPSTKINEIIKADYFKVTDGRLNFFRKKDEKLELYKSYPAQYVIIEKIQKYEE